MRAAGLSKQPVAALLLAVCTAASQAQQVSVSTQSSIPATQQPAPIAPASNNAAAPTTSERRRAAKLYLEAAKLYTDGKFERALKDDEEAAALDPTTRDYAMAAAVARSHAVTALVQEAAKDRIRGDEAAARAAIEHAGQIDPQNPVVLEHLREMADAEVARTAPEMNTAHPTFAPPQELAPRPGTNSFHYRGSQRQAIANVFSAFGIDATVDESVRSSNVRLDLDNATFADATRALALISNTFFVPIDAHRVVVAADTVELRQRFMRSALETIPLYGLTQNEMTDISNVAKNIFGIQTANVDASSAQLTLRASEDTLNAFNSTFRDLTDGRSEVLLDIKMIQLAHTHERNTGAQITQQVSFFNILAEARSILQANQSAVQQIIASGLAGPNDIGTILGILIASGQVSSSLFSGGLVEFGGSCNLSGGTTNGTCSPWAFAAAPGPTTFHLTVNSSDSRALDNFQLRLQDGEEGTLKTGSRYPIETSSFSSLGANSLNIPGLTSAGTSSGLAGLLASTSGASVPNVPMVQYEDLGLTLKTRPRVLRSGDVALTVDMKISALAGAAINSVPILANRSYSGVVTVKQNASVVLAGEIDSQEMRAVSGAPGLAEVPGLNDTMAKDMTKDTSTLLIVITPRVVRTPHGEGHTPMMVVEKDRVGR